MDPRYSNAVSGRRLCSPSFLVCTLLIAPLACDQTAGGSLSGRDATPSSDGPRPGDDGAAIEDADLDGAAQDGPATREDAATDAGQPRPDTGLRPDSGPPSDGGPRADATPRPDTGPRDGGLLSMACEELLVCCNELPQQLQMPCIGVARAGDDMQCMQGLGLAHMVGLCVARPDGGPGDGGVVDSGPKGAVCTELSVCCPSLAPLDMICRNQVATHDEAACGRTLMLAHQAGQCLAGVDGGRVPFDGSLPDFNFDFPDGFIPDISIPDVRFTPRDAGPRD